MFGYLTCVFSLNGWEFLIKIRKQQPFWPPSWILDTCRSQNILIMFLVDFSYLKNMFGHLTCVSSVYDKEVMVKIRKWRPFWTPSWILKNANRGFPGTFYQ